MSNHVQHARSLRVALSLNDAHALPAEQVLAALSTTERGLDPHEAHVRLKAVGRNALPRKETASIPMIALRQFLNPLVYILLIAALVSVVLKDLSDAGFIVAVLVVNAIIGTVQEYGAERSAAALHAMSAARAYVVRNGEDQEIDAEELVPGDLVTVEAGSKFPADLRLLSGTAAEVDESLLTGESLAVQKTPDAVLPSGTALGDRTNLAFAATLLQRGKIRGVVVATGLLTQIGRIAHTLSTTESGRPPLLVRMDRFTRRIAVAIAVSVCLLGSVSVMRGSAVKDVFLLAVALAVAAIPEGLPVALTVALSIGAKRMGRRKVIARRLVAVESLGSCTFIASDKTGTLTMNELTARKILLPGPVPVDVSGEGVTPHGRIEQQAEQAPNVKRLCTAAALCNDAFFGLREGAWVHHGDAVDIALLVLAHKAGLEHGTLTTHCPRLADIPFESERRYAATLHRVDGVPMVIVKGAGEAVLPMCTRMATPQGDIDLDRAHLEAAADRLAQTGHRLLAIAQGPRRDPHAADTILTPDHLSGLVFLGFVAMLDPLRPEAQHAVKACQAAGIQVAMVTGDHPSTALAIAQELGFAHTLEQVVTGQKLAERLAQGERALDDLVSQARVFARVEPTQKLQIVESLKRQGHFVAVTGDGANDAPAMRAAHIGIAIGLRGTDVAKESSDLILTDDNFSSIVAGIEEGRIAYGNVRKVIYLLLSLGLAEVLLFVFAIALAMPVPLWPVQLLWLNLVTNGIQDVALAFEPGEGRELHRPPRPPREPIFNRIMVERMLVSALVMSVVSFVAYRAMLHTGFSLGAAQNMVLLLLVLFGSFQAGNSRSETASLFRQSPFRNRPLLFGNLFAQLLHLAAMYLPGLRDVLHLAPISLVEWMVALGLASSLLFVSEVHKFVRRRNKR